MPLPMPHPNEEQDKFMARCMSFVKSEEGALKTAPERQQLAACFSQWRTEKSNDFQRRMDEEMLHVIGDPHWYGPIIKRDDEKHFVLAPVLIPDEVDLQNDIVTADIIEQAAHLYVADIRKRDKDVDLMHRIDVAYEDMELAESWIAPVDMDINGHTIKKGTWMMGLTIKSETIWGMIQDGITKGFSIFGVGKRTPIE